MTLPEEYILELKEFFEFLLDEVDRLEINFDTEEVVI